MGTRRGAGIVWPIAAALVLLALAAGVAGSFVHTDDGCAVEQHCRACRVALASAGAATHDVPGLPVSQASAAAPFESRPVPLDVVSFFDPSRGPPAAL